MNASFLGKIRLTNRKMWTVPITIVLMTEHNRTSLTTSFSSIVQDKGFFRNDNIASRNI